MRQHVLAWVGVWTVAAGLWGASTPEDLRSTIFSVRVRRMGRHWNGWRILCPATSRGRCERD